ncbi:MAG: TonB family protein [bacterium]|nr:TonB family protein [bacterium]
MNNRDLKEITPFYTKLGLLIILVILCLACLFIPETKPKPYKLKAATPFKPIPLPPQLVLLQEPPPKPKLPVAAKTDEEVEAPTIERTIFEEPLGRLPELKPEIVPFIGVEVKPELLNCVAPEYPELACKAEIEGTVLLEIIIDTLGRVVDIKVTKSLHELCDLSAINAVRQWIYSPGKQRGKPVLVRLEVPVRFMLER